MDNQEEPLFTLTRPIKRIASRQYNLPEIKSSRSQHDEDNRKKEEKIRKLTNKALLKTKRIKALKQQNRQLKKKVSKFSEVISSLKEKLNQDEMHIMSGMNIKNKDFLKVPSLFISKFNPYFDLNNWSKFEVTDLEVWEDVNEGWLEQGNCVQGLKLQCMLYPGENFDMDIMIWPHTAKIWCGTQYGWVRVWQFLERRWLAFSINFAFPVRVMDLQAFAATVTPSFGVASLGSTAKNDKNSEVFLPPLSFGIRRYFAPVLEQEQESLVKFVKEIIWKTVESYIPLSCFDREFDVPSIVTDKRHQDTCLDRVRDLILKKLDETETEEEEIIVVKSKKDFKVEKPKDKEKKKPDSPKSKLEYKLSGERILAGTGRIISFDPMNLPLESPKIIVLISSNNLPAQDDLPIVFLNVENLYQIPLNELKILSVTHLYIKWKVGDEVNCSVPEPLNSKLTINFHNHRALILPYELLTKTTLEFLDSYLKIELRGIRLPPQPKKCHLFGYEKGDREFGRTVPKIIKEELDFLIAVTHINAKSISRGINAFIQGEFPLYPPEVSVKPVDREKYCTNDINCVRAPVDPVLVVQPYVILQAQMTLDVSIGVVGCKPRQISDCFSRMFCTIKDSDAIMRLMRFISEVNNEIMLTDSRDDLLSGFAIDTGSIVILYIEGPRDGHILRVWDMTEDFYPKLKPVFSCSDRYSTRMYPEFISDIVPFVVLKMSLPISAILACPPVYVRPALPLPTRSAVLKIGRLIVNECRSFPSRCQMPTTAELKSFRLELCVAPRPTPVTIYDFDNTTLPEPSKTSQLRINWNK